LGGILLVSAFECYLGFYQYFMQKSLGLKCLHEPFFFKDNLGLASFYSPNGSRWIFDEFFSHENKGRLILRATGSFGHANNYGGFIVFSTIASIYFFLFSKKKWQRITLSIFLFLQLFAICLSYSRSAIFGLCIALISFFVIFLTKRKEILQEYGIKMKRLAAIIVGSLVLCLILLYPQFIERGGVVTYNNLSKASDRGRLNFQVVAFEMIKKHPITGVGFSRFHQRCADFIPQDKKNEFSIGIVHNIYLLIASENGIIALFIFLLFIFSIYQAFFKKSSNLISILFISFFTGFLFIGCCDYYLIEKTMGKLILFFLPTIVVAMGIEEKVSLKKFFRSSSLEFQK
jgi:O-antigen ligase